MPSTADRNRLAAALAYEQERRRRLAEFIPTPSDGTQTAEQGTDVATNLQNLSIGLGRGITTQLQGLKGIVTDPIGSARAGYEAVKGIVRDPSVLAEALRQTGQRAMSGPLGVGEVIGEMAGPMRGRPTMAEIDVYHGSPHRFEEFDASKIGTGEGAQAYGHGIYLAEDPGVAQSYRMTTTGKLHGIAGLPNQKKWQKDLIDDINTMMSREGITDPQVAITKRAEALDRIAAAFPDLKRSNQALAAKKAWLLSQREKVAYEKPGSFYTADLPDEMVDRMLDWDKPLSEQPEVLKTLRKSGLLEKAMKEGGFSQKDVDAGLMQGRHVLSASRSGKANESEALRVSGIPGIKYSDAGSRGQGGTGTRNFVVFPGEEKKVKILKRE